MLNYFQDPSQAFEINLSKSDKNILLNCVFSGDEELKWILPNNKTFIFQEKTIKLLENKSLLIVNATKQDSGVYTCVVNTKNGNQFFRYTVLVNGKFLYTLKTA
jgi:hypothetical protein